MHASDGTQVASGSSQPSLSGSSKSISAGRKENRSPASPLYRYPMAWFGSLWAFGTLVAGLPVIQESNLLGALVGGVGLTLVGGILCHRLAWLSHACLGLSVTLAAMTAALMRVPIGYDSLSAVASKQSQSVALRGVICSVAAWSPAHFEYEKRSDEQESWLTQWNVDWFEIRNEDQWQPIESRSKLLVPDRIYDFLPGDHVEVFGSFRLIPTASNPGATNYAAIAAAQNRYVTVKADGIDQVTRIKASSQFWYSRLRGWAVQKADRVLRRHVSLGQAPLAAALALGQREQVDWEQQQQLMTTGTIHMLAISGLHVEMIAGALLLACILMSMRPKWVLRIVVGFSVLYAGLAGSNPPVLRAVILVAGSSLAKYWGFRSNLFNLLGLAGFVLLLAEPANLTKPGVHLSFIAVATIGIFRQVSDSRQEKRSAIQSLLEESFGRPRKWIIGIRRGIWEATRISLWVWLMTCPLIWLNFNLVSPIAVPLNAILGLPLLLGLMASLLTVVVGWFPPMGWLLGGIAGISLQTICSLVELADAIPWGHFWLPAPPVWWMVVFYSIVVVWISIWKQHFRKLLAVILIAWVAAGVSFYLPGPRGLMGGQSVTGSSVTGSSESESLTCTFLDVGHGTCVLIELPGGRVWMYDAGRIGDQRRSFQHIAPSVWAVPSARIDTLFISHADSDHYNAVIPLLERFTFGDVISTRSFWNSTAEGAIAVRKTLDRKGIPMHTWDSSFPGAEPDGVRIDVVHPPPNFRGETDNANSLCLQLEYAGTRILLSGDIEGSGLVALCEQPARKCEIMMAPHHGSLSVDVAELIDWCQPQVTIISGGERSIRDAVVENYSSSKLVGITFRDGAVRVTIRSDGTYETSHWANNKWKGYQHPN